MSSAAQNVAPLPPISNRRASGVSTNGSQAPSPTATTASKSTTTPTAAGAGSQTSSAAVTPTKQPKYVTLPRPAKTSATSKKPAPGKKPTTTAAGKSPVKPTGKAGTNPRAYGQFGQPGQPASPAAGATTAADSPSETRKVNVQRALKAVDKTATGKTTIDKTAAPVKPVTATRDIAAPPPAKAATAAKARRASPPQPLLATAVSMPVTHRQVPSGPSSRPASASPTEADRHVHAVATRAVPDAAPALPHPPKSPPMLPNVGLFRFAPPPAQAAPPLTAHQRKLVACALLLAYRPKSAPESLSAAFSAVSPKTRMLVEATPLGRPVGGAAIRLVLQPGPPERPGVTLEHVVSTDMAKAVPTTSLEPATWWLARESKKAKKKATVVLSAQQIAETGTLQGPLCSVVMHANFTRSPMKAFEVKETCPRLTVLGLAFCSNLASIKGLALLTALTRLDLGFTRVTSLDAVAECKRLETLSLSNCDGIKDLAVLAKLPALKELFAMGVAVSSVASLAPCKSLEQLVISSPDLTDFSPLGQITTLHTLILTNSRVDTLAWSSGLTDLLHVEANKCDELKDISPLAALPKLETIEINFSAVENAVGFSACTTLKHVGAMRTPLNDASMQELQAMDIELDTL